MTQDLYATLGVARDAPPDALKAAFRRLAKLHHPDRNLGDAGAEERFKACGYAYRVLANPQLRARYDEHGHAGLADDFEPTHEWARTNPDPTSWRRASAVGPGPLLLTIEVTPEEAATGFTREVTYERQIRCQACAGAGGRGPRPCGVCNGLGKKRLGGDPCDACAGSGTRYLSPCSDCRGLAVGRAVNTLLIRVPSGADESSIIRVRGKGHQRGDKDGDVHVRLSLNRQSGPTATPRDVTVILPVTFGEAALGAKVPVDTPAGQVTVSIPAGSSGGRKLRLKGRGHAASTGRGDVIVELRIVVPRDLDPEVRALVEELAARDDSIIRK